MSLGFNIRVSSRLAAMILVGGLLAGNRTQAAEKYTPDKDPVMLGMKALASSQISEAKAHFQEAIENDWKVDEAKFGAGEVAVLEGHYPEAEAIYKEALAVRKAKQKTDYFPEAHASLGLLYMRLGRDAEAAVEIDKAVTQKGNYWPGVYAKARRALEADQIDLAKKLIEKGATKKGIGEGEDKYHYILALLSMKTNDLDKAEKEAMTAFQMMPGENEYGTLVAEIYQKKGSPDMAIYAYEQALKTPGMEASASLYRTLGLLYTNVKKYNEARDSYLKAVEIDSTYAPVLKDLGNLLHMADQNDKAAAVYIRYLQAEPRDIEALVGLAESCLEIHQLAKAQEAAQAAFAQDSTNVPARLAMARVGMEVRDKTLRQQALYLYGSLPDSVRLTARDYARIGASHAEMKNFPQAQTNLDKAMALDPQEPEVHFQLGMLDMAQNQPDSAIVHLEKATTLNPNSELYLLNLGVAYMKANQPEKARLPFRKAIVINNNYAMTHVLLGQSLSSDSLMAAEMEYRKANSLDPKNGAALRGLGFIYQRQNKYMEAVQWYDQGTKAEPGYADGWAQLGNAYLGAKMNDDARRCFQKALEIDPMNKTAKQGLQILTQTKPSAN